MKLGHQFHVYLLWVNTHLAQCLNSALYVKACAFNQEKAPVGAFSVIVKSSLTFVWSSSTIASIYLFVPLLPPYSGIIYIKALARQAQVNLSSDIIQIWFIYLFYLMSSILWADRQEPCRAAIYSDDTQPHNNIKEEVCAGAGVVVSDF